MQQGWDSIPAKGETADKLSLLFTIIGGLGGLSFFYWLWQKWKKPDPESKFDELGSKVERQLEQLRKDLIEQTRAKSAALAAAHQPGAKEAEASIERDIGAAIATLSEAGKTAALAALKRGDTLAADAALAANIAEIEMARTGAAKEEAALYRQRGALAYLNDTQAALRFYAKAEELDPDDGEGLFFLGQLQARAGYGLAAKQSFERLIALGNQIEGEASQHWAHLLLGDVEGALGNRNIAQDRYERGQTLVQDLIQRDPNNAEWQRDLSVSYNKIGDISAARGDRDGALKAYQDGLEIRKLLAARDPNNAEWQRDLSVSYNKIGDIRADRGDRDGALKA